MSSLRYRWKDAVWASALNTREKCLALAFFEHMNGDGECWPSRRRLADMTGLSQSTVYRITRRFEGVWLILDRRLGRATRYRALVPDTPGQVLTRVPPSSFVTGAPGQALTPHPGHGDRRPRSSFDTRTSPRTSLGNLSREDGEQTATTNGGGVPAETLAFMSERGWKVPSSSACPDCGRHMGNPGGLASHQASGWCRQPRAVPT
jgi:hypothetical protein